MIQIIEGKGVGSGKSYMVVEMLIHHFRQGGSAFCSESFEIKWEELKALVRKRWGLKLQDTQYHSVKGSDIFRLHEVTSGGTDEMPVLIVVDEAQDELNARDWADTSKRNLFKWACQSRHDSNDIIFVTQAAQNIDKQIRRITTYTWSIRNLNTFPIPGFGKVGPLVRGLVRIGTLNAVKIHGIIFVRSLLDWDGRTQLERKLVVADSGFFGCYESKSMKQKRPRLGEPIGKKTLERERSKSPMMRFLIPVAVVSLICGIVYVTKHGIIPKPVLPKQQVELAKTTVATPSKSPEKAQNAYDVERQHMIARGPGWCKTTQGGYFVPGRMSSLGMVEAIQGNVIRVRRPDSKTLYVLAEDWGVPTKVIVAKAAPTPGQIIIAKDAAREEAMMRGVVKPSLEK